MGNGLGERLLGRAARGGGAVATWGDLAGAGGADHVRQHRRNDLELADRLGSRARWQNASPGQHVECRSRLRRGAQREPEEADLVTRRILLHAFRNVQHHRPRRPQQLRLHRPVRSSTSPSSHHTPSDRPRAPAPSPASKNAETLPSPPPGEFRRNSHPHRGRSIPDRATLPLPDLARPVRSITITITIAITITTHRRENGCGERESVSVVRSPSPSPITITTHRRENGCGEGESVSVVRCPLSVPHHPSRSLSLSPSLPAAALVGRIAYSVPRAKSTSPPDGERRAPRCSVRGRARPPR